MAGKTGYTKLIAALNGYDIQRWLISDGMGFGSLSKWWSQGVRRLPHNGIDLRAYEDSYGRMGELDSASLIPAIGDGRVLGAIKDFMARTVFVEHEPVDGRRFVSAYGHVAPDAQCVIGYEVREGQSIATLSVSPDMPVPAHLHLSLILLPADIETSTITWQTLDAGAAFMDPSKWL